MAKMRNYKQITPTRISMGMSKIAADPTAMSGLLHKLNNLLQFDMQDQTVAPKVLGILAGDAKNSANGVLAVELLRLFNSQPAAYQSLTESSLPEVPGMSDANQQAERNKIRDATFMRNLNFAADRIEMEYGPEGLLNLPSIAAIKSLVTSNKDPGFQQMAAEAVEFIVNQTKARPNLKLDIEDFHRRDKDENGKKLTHKDLAQFTMADVEGVEVGNSTPGMGTENRIQNEQVKPPPSVAPKVKSPAATSNKPVKPKLDPFRTKDVELVKEMSPEALRRIEEVSKGMVWGSDASSKNSNINHLLESYDNIVGKKLKVPLDPSFDMLHRGEAAKGVLAFGVDDSSKVREAPIFGGMLLKNKDTGQLGMVVGVKRETDQALVITLTPTPGTQGESKIVSKWKLDSPSTRLSQTQGPKPLY